MHLSDDDLRILRRKLQFKVRYQLGGFCPDIEDVVQESLARLLEAEQAGKIQQPENPGAFLNGICNNVILEYRRRLQRDGAYPSEDPPERPAPGISHAEELVLHELISSALAELVRRDREVLAGLYLDGKTPEEVCAQNGIQQSHLKVVVSRAKARFRRIYEDRVKSRGAGGHMNDR